MSLFYNAPEPTRGSTHSTIQYILDYYSVHCQHVVRYVMLHFSASLLAYDVHYILN